MKEISKGYFTDREQGAKVEKMLTEKALEDREGDQLCLKVYEDIDVFSPPGGYDV